MGDRASRLWQSLTTGEAQAAAATDPVVVLPLAAIEQHGPHLPLSTDLDIGMGILSDALGRLPDEFPVWTLPPQAVGASQEHASFAGTLTIGAETLVDVIHRTGRSLAGAGVRRLVLANSHGGNRAAMDVAALRVREEARMLVVKASWFRFARPEGVELPEGEWVHGLHGGAVETSMMMHIRPDLVRGGQARDFPSLGDELEGSMGRLGPEGEASFAWLASDLDRSGVVGDASLATAELGERLVAGYGAALAEVIHDARRFPLERLSG